MINPAARRPAPVRRISRDFSCFDLDAEFFMKLDVLHKTASENISSLQQLAVVSFIKHTHNHMIALISASIVRIRETQHVVLLSEL